MVQNWETRRPLTGSEKCTADPFVLNDNVILPPPAVLKPSEATLGDLEHVPSGRPFPLELLWSTLRKLDLRSLANFRCVNRRSVEVTDSMTEYKALRTHAPTALAGILKVGAGKWIICEELVARLRHAECVDCGSKAKYIYIFTCERLCLRCLVEKMEYLPLSYNQARQNFQMYGSLERILDNVPSIDSLPGTYGAFRSSSPLPGSLSELFEQYMGCEKRIKVLDVASVERAAKPIHGSAYVKPFRWKWHQIFLPMILLGRYRKFLSQRNDTQRFPWFPEDWGFMTILREHSTTRLTSFDRGETNTMRFVSVVRMPELRPGATEVSWGVHRETCHCEYFDHLKHSRIRVLDGTASTMVLTHHFKSSVLPELLSLFSRKWQDIS